MVKGLTERRSRRLTAMQSSKRVEASGDGDKTTTQSWMASLDGSLLVVTHELSDEVCPADSVAASRKNCSPSAPAQC